MTKTEPKGDYCEIINMLTESFSCPDLDQSGGILHPKCSKYSKSLSWNMSGHIHKCQKCIEKGK